MSNPTILCIETLISAKQAINNKLQGSVATYLKCGGVVNNQIKKKMFKIVEYLAKITSKNVVVSCTSSFRSVVVRRTKEWWDCL